MNTDKRKPSGRSRWVVLAVLGVAIILAAALLLQMLPILFGIINPPLPPLLDSARVISHRPVAHGLDEWTYEIERPACEVLAYYAERADGCRLVLACPRVDSPVPLGQIAGECTGHVDFSLFKMQWVATIAADLSRPDLTVFQLTREVFWGGEIPPVRFERLMSTVEAQERARTTPTP